MGGGGGGASNEEYEDDPNKVVPQAENIDHILDNMFVQRAPYQPTTTTLAAAAARKSTSPAPVDEKLTVDVDSFAPSTEQVTETASPEVLIEEANEVEIENSSPIIFEADPVTDTSDAVSETPATVETEISSPVEQIQTPHPVVTPEDVELEVSVSTFHIIIIEFLSQL